MLLSGWPLVLGMLCCVAGLTSSGLDLVSQFMLFRSFVIISTAAVICAYCSFFFCSRCDAALVPVSTAV